MRHRKKFNHLSRKTAHRKAMFSNMASSLILHKKIKTTLPKAKALRMYIEPLITKAKYTYTTKTKVEEATHLRRIVFSYLKQKKAVAELFREVAPKILNRNGGYTRILKLGKRLGDNAELCMIELVDFNENMLKAKDTKEKKEVQPKKTTRRGRRGKGTATTSKSTEVKAEKKEIIKDEKKVTKKVAEKKEKKPTEKEKTISKPKVETKVAKTETTRKVKKTPKKETQPKTKQQTKNSATPKSKSTMTKKETPKPEPKITKKGTEEKK